jgi:hypothetical protein
MGAAESTAATAAERRSLRSSSWNETKNAIKWQLAEHADNQHTPKYLTNILKLEQNCCFVICILLPFVLLHSFVYKRYYVYQKQQRRMKHILDITLCGFSDGSTPVIPSTMTFWLPVMMSLWWYSALTQSSVTFITYITYV